MTRKFLDDLKATATATLETDGETTALELLAIQMDGWDSTINDECAIASNTPFPGFVTSPAWQPLGAGIYDQSIGGDIDFLKLNVAAGEIGTSSIPGFSYAVRGSISFTDMQNNRHINFVILADGVPVGFVARDTGRGNGKPVSASFEHLSLSTPANTIYQIGVQTDDGANTVDILDVGLAVTIKPTNNP